MQQVYDKAFFFWRIKQVGALPALPLQQGQKIRLRCAAPYQSSQLCVIAQRKVAVLPGDTPESLHARIQEVEHVLYPEALEEVFREIPGCPND